MGRSLQQQTLCASSAMSSMPKILYQNQQDYASQSNLSFHQVDHEQESYYAQQSTQVSQSYEDYSAIQQQQQQQQVSSQGDQPLRYDQDTGYEGQSDWPIADSYSLQDSSNFRIGLNNEHQAYQQSQSNEMGVRPKEVQDFNNNNSQQRLGSAQSTFSSTVADSDQRVDTYHHQSAFDRDQQFSSPRFCSFDSSTTYRQSEQTYNHSNDESYNHHHLNTSVTQHHPVVANISFESVQVNRNRSERSIPARSEHSPNSSQANIICRTQQHHISIPNYEPDQQQDYTIHSPTLKLNNINQYQSQQYLETPTYKIPTQQSFEQYGTVEDEEYSFKSAYSLSATHFNSNQCNNPTNSTISVTAVAASKGPAQEAIKIRSLKGRRGRPRKKGLRSKDKVNGKLWEFIRDLLLSDRTNPSFIRWERREDGVFKFVQSDKVAKMWGERKQNPKMTYEKLSRAMRYYYKSKVLLPVFGRRLVYKFGPNATGWLPNSDDTLH